MASVSLARLSTAEGFTKWVAIKTIHPHLAAYPKIVRMFLNEATLAARIDDPNVCSVFDFGEADGVFFLAMEYLHGESLGSMLRRSDVVQRPGLPLSIAARIIADAARGLHAAHELLLDDGRPAGVVHRDVSPQNLFVLYSGVTKVVDFGVARSFEHTGENTSTDEIKGKVAYMSPEQIRAQPLDRRADVWALGVVFWECIAGARLFKGGNGPTTMHTVLEEAIPVPLSPLGDVPPEIAAIIARALSRNVEHRYPTALALARDLEAWLAKSGSAVGPDDVASKMRDLFHDDMVIRDELLHRPLHDSSGRADAEFEPPAGADTLQDDAEPTTRKERPLPAHTPTVEQSVQLSWNEASRTVVATAPVPLVTIAHTERRASTRRSTFGLVAALAMLVGNGSSGLSAPVQPSPTARNVRSEANVPQGPSAQTDALHVELPAQTPTPAPTQDGGSSDASTAPRASVVPHAASIQAASNARTDPPAHRRAGHQNDAVDPTDAVSTLDGSLTVSAPARCEVFEGTRSLGHTPIVALPMTPGEHSLRVVPDSGDPAQHLNVTIAPGIGAVVGLQWQ